MFEFTDILPLGEDQTEYQKLNIGGVSVEKLGDQEFLRVSDETLEALSERAMKNIAHFLRSSHLEQLRKIYDASDSTDNERFVARELLQNAVIAAGQILPGCQDTGTAIVKGKKGQFVLTGGNDKLPLSKGIYETYQNSNLRYSQLSPIDMFSEKNTKTNLPAEIKIESIPGEVYKFMFMAKGGGSANKSYLFQETKALLNEKSLLEFLDRELRKLGTAACPPYHLGVVIGGTSAEFAVECAKLASTRYLDSLPTSGGLKGNGYRDTEWESKILALTQSFDIGAQFGGRYFCHDVRVIRLPRHGASCPVGIAVSCSADRQALAKITRDGVFLEKLEEDPGKYLPETSANDLSGEVIKVDLNQPMSDIRKLLTQYPIRTRLSLTGTLVVARDIAHAKIKERLDAGEPMPKYLQNHPVYYAGPAKTPKEDGYASGSFGPTTASRMDPYVDLFQSKGGSFVMLAKGNRSRQVTDACEKHGGFYLGSIGGPAARLAKDSIRKVEVLEYQELGMEAIWRIEVEDFPAFIIVDDKGNNMFAPRTPPHLL